MERGWNISSSPACPRCGSSNTKFCYYNNYSLTQPRYLCKACRRYWTKGGSLRNVPIGGGCRKSRRPKNLLSPHKNININDNAIVDTISTTTAITAATIDLAAVYANFLNQAPRPHHHHNNNYDHESQLLSDIPAERIGFSSLDMFHWSSQENGFFECPEPQLGNNFSGLNNSLILPALPGEGTLWVPELGSDVILMENNQMLAGPGTVEQLAGNDQNIISPGALDGNVSPFSPLINLEAIFRS